MTICDGRLTRFGTVFSKDSFALSEAVSGDYRTASPSTSCIGRLLLLCVFASLRCRHVVVALCSCCIQSEFLTYELFPWNWTSCAHIATPLHWESQFEILGRNSFFDQIEANFFVRHILAGRRVADNNGVPRKCCGRELFSLVLRQGAHKICNTKNKFTSSVNYPPWYSSFGLIEQCLSPQWPKERNCVSCAKVNSLDEDWLAGARGEVHKWRYSGCILYAFSLILGRYL